MIEIGQILELVCYPVKSMAGVPTQAAFLGWHGLAGDRRFALRRLGDASGFPWLSASRLPDLLRYQPEGKDEQSAEPLPTHVRTPEGELLALFGSELASEVGARLGSDVELMRLKHGIFDDAPVSVITPETIAGIGTAAGTPLDRRRFRANIVISTPGAEPFCEDRWVGGRLLFGNGATTPAVAVTARDIRCAMVNLDPDTTAVDKRVVKTIVHLNQNHAGVYGTAVATGTIRVGDPVYLLAGPGS